MRAMVLTQPGEADPLRLEQRETPAPGPGEVTIAVSTCAVCRTDLQLASGDLPAHRLPIVPGHQAVGRVAVVGDGVRGLSVGDRVGVGWVAGTCGRCEHCQSGAENLCQSATFTGWDRDGGFADQLTISADFAHHLPDGLPDAEAAPLLCGGIIGYRSLHQSGIRPGGTLGLYGFGASATLALQVARHWGCTVYVAARGPHDRERALAAGADWAGDIIDAPPTPLDAAVTFAPAGRVMVAALRALKPGGTVAINAIHLDGIPSFSYDLLWGERTIRSVANFTRQDAREFLQLAAAVPIRPQVEVHPLTSANRALARIADGSVSGAAVLRV